MGTGFALSALLLVLDLFFSHKKIDEIIDALPDWLGIPIVLLLCFYGVIELTYWLTGKPDTTRCHPE